MKELWLCTREYPTGRGEFFLQHAIPIWSQQFDKVVVIPMYLGPGELALPANVELVRLWDGANYEPLSIRKSLLRAPAVLRGMARHGRKDWNSTREILSHSRQLLQKAQVFRDQLMPRYNVEVVSVLSIWMEDWLSVLGTVKDREHNFKFASMGHGWDLFEHRRATRNIPYRTFQLEALDQLLVISQAGSDHITSYYPKHAEKVTQVRLGTPDHGPAPWSPDSTLRLASCSYLREPKRVDLIAKALALMERPVHWTHFGDGPERAALEQLINSLPSNVVVDLRGFVQNKQILEWFSRSPVDLFLHLSESEGLPLVLMEASSFGIPLLANSVGGVCEIVGPSTGTLLSEIPEPKQLLEAIENAMQVQEKEASRRETVRSYWRSNFSMENNYTMIGEVLMNSTLIH